VSQFARRDATSLSTWGGIVTLPTKQRDEPAAGVLSGHRTRRPPCVQLASETYYGTIDARTIIHHHEPGRHRLRRQVKMAPLNSCDDWRTRCHRAVSDQAI